ncbi:MAG: hypothetical protein Fur0041_18440 [Bacteroidia bacterium]
MKDESGNTIAQYRIRLKSVEKFIGNSVECKYKIEVKNLTDKTLITDLDYSYYQKLGANSEKKSSTIKGWINKKKTWLFEFSVFNDKSETDKSQADPCHNCDLSYKLIFSVSKY